MSKQGHRDHEINLLQGCSQEGARGAIAPPFFPGKVKLFKQPTRSFPKPDCIFLWHACARKIWWEKGKERTHIVHASSVVSWCDFRFRISRATHARVAFLCVLLCITHSNCSTCHSGYRYCCDTLCDKVLYVHVPIHCCSHLGVYVYHMYCIAFG